MNYSALIQNRKSVREFTEEQVPFGALEVLKNYYLGSVRRLVPEIETELHFFGTATREALEGAAGYHDFLVGAPQYLILLSQRHPLEKLNAGYMMEDLILKLADLDLDSCWLSFKDSEQIKQVLGIESELDVAAIAAFGFGKKTVRRLRLNFLSMSNVDITAKHRYMEPKRGIQDLAYLNRWGEQDGLEAYIGFYEDMLWEALYAASLSPSYLNRQAYGFVLHDGGVSVVSRPDKYTTEPDGQLSLGAAMLHFGAVAENWAGKLQWRFDGNADGLELPEGHRVVAHCSL